jgi:hypothetical protein
VSEVHAKAYLDPGTPEEQSRRAFMANATVVLGGVIGLIIGVPLLISSVPGNAINSLSGEQWSDLSEDDLKKLAEVPAKVTFTRKSTDGYFAPEGAEDYVWGVKMTPAQYDEMKKDRQDLFGTDKAS